MSVIIFDYNTRCTQDDIKRLSDIGIRMIYLVDWCHEHYLAPNIYNFDDFIQYSKWCQASDIQLFIHSPVGSPLWFDSSFF